MSTTAPTLALPAPFERIVDLLVRGYGTSDLATRLMVLNAVAAGSGNNLRIRTPECGSFIPALNLGLITGGGALAQGALMSLLLPLTRMVEEALEFGAIRGFAYTAAELASFLRDRRNFEDRIAQVEKEIKQLGTTPVETPEEQAAVVEEIFQSCQNGETGPIARRKELLNGLRAWREQLHTAKLRIFQGQLESRGHILLKDGRWQEFPEHGRRSFDGNWGHLVFAPQLLAELCTLPRRDLLACAATLQRTLTGSSLPGKGGADIRPGAWAILCGDPAIWANIMARPLVAESGLLHDFVFCAADAETTAWDPAAMAALAEDPMWSKFLQGVMALRLCNSPAVLAFDPIGTAEFLALRRWSRQFAAGLPAEVRPYFAHWPDVAARLALGLAVIHDATRGETLPGALVTAACAFVRHYAPIQAGLIQKLEARDSRALEAEREVQRAVGKLRQRGPLSLRGLVRTYDRQDYGLIEGALQRAVQRGLVEQRGSLFLATDVSGSSVSEPNVLNFPQGVET